VYNYKYSLNARSYFTPQITEHNAVSLSCVNFVTFALLSAMLPTFTFQQVHYAQDDTGRYKMATSCIVGYHASRHRAVPCAAWTPLKTNKPNETCTNNKIAPKHKI